MPLVFTRRALHHGKFTNGIASKTRFGQVDRTGGSLRFTEITRAGWAAAVDRQSGDGSVLLSIHGYNTSQTRFYNRLLLLENGLQQQGFRGAIVGFGWPSQGDALHYPTDKNTAKQIARYMVDDGVAPLRAGGRKLHVLAHSMGCYITLKALAPHGDGPGGAKWFDQVLFTAADVDDVLMRKGALGTLLLRNRATRFTHYYNPLDDVLAVPGLIINGGRPRAGRLGMQGARYSNHHDVSGQEYFRVHARDLNAPHDEQLQNSHGWWFDQAGVLRDMALTLNGTSPASIPTRQNLSNGAQRLKP